MEVLSDVLERHRPASEALKDWGKSHRFAGSGDRHAIGTLVYDALRQRSSAAHVSGDGSPRGLVFGILKSVWEMSVNDIAALCNDEHGPGALTAEERVALGRDMKAAHVHIHGNFPAWLEPSLGQVFGDRVAIEMAALALRAPVDLRVNTLKASRQDVLGALAKFGAAEGPISPWSVRIPAPNHDSKHVSAESEASHGMGWFEVQDTASQIAVLLTGVKAGEKVADICAGAGGKTLALAAMMNNQGRLVAHDLDKRRLRPIFERITRAGASCIEVIAAEDGVRLASFGDFDCVVVDAPCTGTGTWRRKPDTKWKLKPATLEMRVKDQGEVLARGAKLVKVGGRLAYFTCSVLPEENSGQLDAFLVSHPGFKIVPYTDQWKHGPAPLSADGSVNTLLLTPAMHGTDGFFAAILKRVS
jgi:16S rRNA (cytosine967-C5)-methyltransferase